MRTATEEFFERLGQATHDPRLSSVRGTVRFEIMDGESTQCWHIAVLHGDVVVSRDDEAADGVFRSSLEMFDRIVVGDANVMSAVLRGTVTYQGDPQFGVIFRRLFGSGAPVAHDLPAAAKEQS